MTGGWENLLPLVAIVLLIVAGAPLLWLSNRWIEQRRECSGHAAIASQLEGQNRTERLKAPKSSASPWVSNSRVRNTWV